MQTARGVRYTRNGSFHINATGQLLDSEENPVLGPNGTLNLPPGDVAIGEDGSISVAGAVEATPPCRFRTRHRFQQEGSSYLVAPQSAEQPATTSKVEQGMLESANLNPVTLTVTMMDLQRHAELLERTLSIFQNDLNRTAIEDLARVS